MFFVVVFVLELICVGVLGILVVVVVVMFGWIGFVFVSRCGLGFYGWIGWVLGYMFDLW